MSIQTLYITDVSNPTGLRAATLEEIMSGARHALASRVRKGAVLDSPKATADFLTLRLAEKDHEVFTLIYLDTRHRLIAAAEAFAKEGIVPPGVDEPEVYRQRSGALLLSKDRSNDWFEATKDQRAAFVYPSAEEIRASFVRE